MLLLYLFTGDDAAECTYAALLLLILHKIIHVCIIVGSLRLGNIVVLDGWSCNLPQNIRML